MTWNRITGQNRVKNHLQKAIIENRIPHAYCFWGQEGIGKDALAIEFARTLNCSSPIVKGDSIEPCENCPNCKMSKTLQHPNIRIVFSLPAGKSGDTKKDATLEKLTDEQLELYYEQIRLKSENLYHKLTLPNANQIRIAAIREIKKNLALSPPAEGRRCIIISRAEDMTTEAENAFLKTLEEPHENVTIIITTSRPEIIIPTILSRCQQVRCEPLSDIDIVNALHEKNGIASEEASLISAFAQGSYTTAVEFLGTDLQEIREKSINLLRTIFKKKTYRNETASYIEGIIKKHDRRETEILLNLLILWMRDASNYKKINDENNIINKDKIEILKKFATGFPHADYDKSISEIENAIILIRKNVAPQLILLNLIIVLRKVFLFG